MSGRFLGNLSAQLMRVHGQQVRSAYVTHGVHPLFAKTLKERLAELNYKDPELHYKVDIGFKIDEQAQAKLSSELMKVALTNKRNAALERKSRLKQLTVDIEETQEIYHKMEGLKSMKVVGEHYGIFEHLFGDAYFHPVVRLNVHYDIGKDDMLAPVYLGNILKPKETQKPPTVEYKAEKESLWTLVLTTPDGVLTPANEWCHWFIGNIPGNDLSKGEQLVDYLRPIPSRGIGYCRYVFVLYKQDKKIDFSEYKQDQPCLELAGRDWNTYDFYKKHQDVMTPASFAFFQCDWDITLTDFFHDTLSMREPVFEYDFEAPYVARQKWFPKRQPFNLYLDKYRDPKEINSEYLIAKLKKTHPFNGPETPLKFPNAHFVDIRNLPSWLVTKMQRDRLQRGRINELNEDKLVYGV